MQRQIIFLSVLSLFVCFWPTKAQSESKDLHLADSLFKQQRYTQAFEIFDSLYQQSDLQSNQMLLKMAFIKEGLNDYSNAIFYLNKYYNQSFDKKALEKIRELAEKHKLKGYEFNDVRFFETLLHQYRWHLMWTVFGLAVFSAFLGFIKYFRKKIFSTNSLISIGLLTVLGYALVFLPDFQQKAIIKENALIYTLPSSGSDILETAEKGRQVRILDEIDVWTVISFEEKEAYIKSSYIRRL